MAREILFKAKRKDNGEWVEGLLWKKKYKSNKWFISCFPDKDDNEEVYVIDINTLCQYTGLTDKNGNKIWENDVVRNEYERNGFQTLKIYYSTENAKYVLMNAYKMFTDFDSLLGQLEVIGNIFDNPELLGGADNG